MLLITSLYEGYPIAGIEACIHGRPIVAFDSFPAAHDLISDGESSIVLDSMTPQVLAEAVKTILSDPAKYRLGALKHRMLYQMENARSQWQDLFEYSPDIANDSSRDPNVKNHFPGDIRGEV